MIAFLAALLVGAEGGLFADALPDFYFTNAILPPNGVARLEVRTPGAGAGPDRKNRFHRAVGSFPNFNAFMKNRRPTFFAFFVPSAQEWWVALVAPQRIIW